MSSDEVLKNGFLDDKIIDPIKYIRNKFQNLFSIIFSLNQICYEDIYNSIDCEGNDYICIYVATIVNEIHNSFQSVVILLERGLRNDALSILRGIYEKTFKMKAIILDRDNYKYIKIDDLLNKNRINKMVKKSECLENLKESSFEDEKFEKFFKEITGDEYKNNLRPFSPREWALRAKMLPKYEKQYTVLCDFTHYNFSLAKDKIVEEKEGLILNSDLNYENLDEHLLDLINIFSIAMLSYCEFKNLHETKEKIINIISVPI